MNSMIKPVIKGGFSRKAGLTSLVKLTLPKIPKMKTIKPMKIMKVKMKMPGMGVRGM